MICLSQSRAKSVVSQIAWITAACMLLAIATVPWSPTMPEAALDPSWQTMMHEAYVRHFVFGRDIIFTYGPYGFALTDQFHPRTFSLHLAIRFLIAVSCVLGLAAVTTRPLRQLFVATAALTIVLPWGGQTDTLFAMVPLLGSLVGIVEKSHFEKRVAVLLSIGSGLIATMKFTFLVFGFIVFAIGDLTRFVDRRAWPLYSTIWVGSILVFWIVAHQPLEALFSFLGSSISIAQSYSETMQMASGSLTEELSLLAFVACSFAMALYFWQRGRARLFSPRVIGSGLIVALFVFLGWKEGFVRADVHMMIALNTAFIAALVLTFLGDRLFPDRRAPWLEFVCVTLGFTASMAVDAPFLGDQNWPLQTVEHLADNATSAVTILSDGGLGILKREHQDAIAKIKAEYPLDIGEKPVDIMPWRSVVPLALGLTYRPRPMFQSYAAYNSYLSKTNNDQLLSERGPQIMLLEIAPIDGRLATEEDPDIFLSLLQRFELRGRQGKLLVLERRSNPKVQPGRVLGKGPLNFGEWVKLPQVTNGEVLWIQADIKPTLLGWFVESLFRRPILAIEVKFADGHWKQFRLVPDVLRSGFIISPIFTSIDDYIAASNGSINPAGSQPISIRWTGARLTEVMYERRSSATFMSYSIFSGLT
jgi:hypothetical protein